MQPSNPLAEDASTAHGDYRIAELLARETDTPLPIAKMVYDEEVSKLAKRARIKQFLGVLAARNTRLRLRRH